MEEVFELLKKIGTYYLATVDGDKPRVRPFGTVDLYNGKLYIQTGKKKDVSKQIEKNPNVELCAFQDGVWVRVAGKLVNDDSREAKKHMLDNYPNLRGMYNEEDNTSPVFYFEYGVATIYSFTSQPKVIKL